MVVFVVLHCFVYRFFIKSKLGFQLGDNLRADVKLFVVMAETGNFRLIEFIERVLANAFNIYTLLWVCFKNSRDEVLSVG